MMDYDGELEVANEFVQENVQPRQKRNRTVAFAKTYFKIWNWKINAFSSITEEKFYWCKTCEDFEAYLIKFEKWDIFV